LSIKKTETDQWLWIESEKEPGYNISGKYLFFSENRERLIEIAENEIENYGFHRAKTPITLIGNLTDYVLCLYYEDDSRKYELSERHRQLYHDVEYRYWKSDIATLRGEYSQEYLEKLNKKSS
jgi:hypothetical protein